VLGPPEVRQPYGLAVLVLQLEIGGLLADLDRHSLVLSAGDACASAEGARENAVPWARRYAQSAISRPRVRTPAWAHVPPPARPTRPVLSGGLWARPGGGPGRPRPPPPPRGGQ